MSRLGFELRISGVRNDCSANCATTTESPKSFFSLLFQIIRSELHRNVSLAIVSIYFATIFLLSDFKASIFVLICVFVTLTNVSGIMHFWGQLEQL